VREPLGLDLGPDRLLDLTQPLGPSTILWPGSRPFVAETEVDYETGNSYARDLSLSEHSGTHLDAPIHFAEGGLAVHELPIAALVRPAVRLDVRDFVGDDPSFTLTVADVERLEQVDGAIPRNAAVLVCTGWDRFREDPERYRGRGGTTSFPGVGPDAAQLLVDRGVAGIGIDTLGVDPGYADDFPAHRTTLPAGLWHLEGLVGLEGVPARGAWLVAAAIPLVDGSGAPARVFAILP
jgi:kynurenine formamidase